MQYLERLQELEEEIRQRKLTGEKLQDTGIFDEYIDLVQQIEGAPISEFTMKDAKKYKYLRQIMEFKNNEGWENLGR